MRKILTLLSIAVLLVACSSTTPIEIRISPKDSLEEIKDTELCPLAEKHLKLLYCIPLNKSFQNGETFTQFCEESQLRKIFLNPRCLSLISSCDEVKTCY